MPTPTSIALVSMRVSLKGIFSGNFSLVMATSKQSPKSMWRMWPVRRSNIRLEGCLCDGVMVCVYDGVMVCVCDGMCLCVCVCDGVMVCVIQVIH